MKILEAAVLKDMIIGGYKYLAANKEMVNALNVFPVPDGDTGTNMSLTIASAVKELEDLGEKFDMGDVLKCIAHGTLRGARGNSGVILSQIMRGLTKALEDAEQISTKAFAKALAAAREMAYNAVTKPKEGTVLTVIRYIAEKAPSLASKKSDFAEFFAELIKKGEEILQKTPDMLPVLKKAGVVDAGGRGLLCVFTGAYKVLVGEPIEEEQASVDYTVAPAQTAMLSENISEEHDYDNIKFAYCTEYFVVNLKKHCTEEDIEKLRDKLMAIGDCVIVIGDISLIKVHVHTNQPNRALGYALQLGELDKVKIENMLQQHRAIVEERERNKKPLGMVAVCAGAGLARIFKDLGVDFVIEGGQTMNPSVEDILVAVERVNADNIIILPNNKNIIMAAEKVNELSKKNVSVVPSVSVTQGIRAAMAFDSEQDMSVNCTNMTKAFKDLTSGEVTHAVRNTNMDGFALHEGDIIGISGDKIVAQSRQISETTERWCKNLWAIFPKPSRFITARTSRKKRQTRSKRSWKKNTRTSTWRAITAVSRITIIS